MDTRRRLAEVLDPLEVPELLDSSATWGEGPLWLAAESTLIWSDIPGNRILCWSPTEGAGVWRTNVEFTNGRTLDRSGAIVTCSHGRRAIERSYGNEDPHVLVDSWSGHRLNSPNDVVVDSHGAVWFTDPPYGIIQPHEGHPGQREYGDNWVFRYDPVSGSIDPVITDIEEPNGLAFSPDESILYVSDTSAALSTNNTGNMLIRAYDVVGATRCKNGRVFATMSHGLADGFRVDMRGNLWTSHGPYVSVIGPDGTWLGDIEFPETVGNLCFGGATGSDLFVVASQHLFRLHTLTKDGRR